MKQLSSNELRALFLKFFQKKGHSVIPSASVIPENDPTVLFTTAGMHPLVPYLLGIRDILEIDSVDETDSFRKCGNAHKGTINLSCILYPEKLSADGKNTVYHAKQEFKDYL